VSELPKSARPLKVVTAERDKPLSASPKPLKERVTNEVADAALNAASVARDGWRGFQAANRWFKLKALIVGSWLVLSLTSLVVACPIGLKRRNSLGAELVIGQVADHPVYMIKNDSRRPWREVVVVVNDRYRAAAGMVESGSNLTFGPNQLLGANGQAAPKNLPLVKIEVRTAEGNEILVNNARAP
jgi:hypothetical protein